MGRSLRLSLSVLLVVSVLWKSADADKCALACKGSSTTPTFLSGHKYSYGVEGTVSIYLTGADKQETSVKLLGQATVVALGNCVHELKVQNLAISGPDGKKYTSPPGTDKPIRFTLQDGRVGSEICVEDGDTRRSLNIKRAIVSLLQSENKPSTQVDVFGACPTEASSSQEGAALLVHRTRDLSRCAHREQGRHDLVTGVFNPTAEIKNTQILQSTLNVESKVNSGVPEKVSAVEEYLYKPFSVGENGARAKVHTKLTLTGKAAGGAGSGNCNEQRTIIFENPHGHPSASNFEASIAAIRDTAKTLTTEASSKSAGEFAQLVRILRFASKEDLSKIYGQVKGQGLQRRVFLDGLVRTGTGAAVETTIELIKMHELNPIETKIALLSLSNAKHTTNDALKAAAGLVDAKLPYDAYLGLGALAGVYCREHDCHNVKADGVVALSQKLGNKLQGCKPKDKKQEDEIVAVLKGIRNMRHLEDSLVDKLVSCANDNSGKARVRVAALEAFGAEPCATKAHKAAMELMKNHQLDSEIRIKAYLAVIECPCAHSASEIKTLLVTEPVHQVGRFISSSLRHIRNSANPDRAHQRHHYSQISTPNRFNIDDRKYSFFREFSYNVDALGIGGSLEETVIYSQDSFLPRSASFNVTAELFGHSLNVLELGGRQGNLDRVVEHFLGPRSFLRTQKPQEVYDNIVKRFHDAEKKASDTLSRGRRSVKTEVDNFDKHLKAESTSFHNELDLDLYVKLFGTDAFFLSLGDDHGKDFNDILDILAKATHEGIDAVKHLQHELRAHLLFLDAELVYPTSTGFPLKLDLVGSATGRVKIGTNLDIRQIYRSFKNAKIDVELVPSTDVEVAGLFLVDADAVSTGLKVVTNLHSSTGGHLVAKVIEDGYGVDLQFGLPIDKQEIVTASNDLVYITREKGQKEKQTALKIDSPNKEYSGCFDQASRLIGLTLCGEVVVPFSVSGVDAQASIAKYLARYPLTGPSKLKLVLEKNDLRGYHVKGVFRTDDPRKRTFEVLFDAEGTKANRRTSVSGELINTPEEISAKVSLDSPIKTLSGQLTFLNKPSERVLVAKAKHDGDEYYAKAGFRVQGSGKREVFTPIAEYQIPDKQGKKNLKVDGQLVLERGDGVTKYSLENIKVTLPNPNEVIDLNGHLKLGRDYELEVHAKKGEHKMQVVGSFTQNKDVKIEFKNTLNPYVNFKVNGHFDNHGGNYHNDLELAYGNNFEDSHSRVIFNQLLKNPGTGSFITKNKFEIRALPFKVKLDAEVDPKKVDFEVEGQYLDKKGELDLEARSHIKKPGDYSIKFSAEFDKEKVEAFAKRDIESADKSNFENYIVINKNNKYELSGVVLHKNNPNDFNFGAIGHVKVAAKRVNEEIKFDIGAIGNPTLYSSHAKVSNSQGEILDFLLKLTRGGNPTGQLKFNLKDTVSANGNYKVTDNDGKGNGIIIVDFKKSQHKVKGDVKFVVKDPIYNVELDLFLNLDKDNNDKLHFSTNTKRTPALFKSDNKVDYRGQKLEVNLHREGPLAFKGKQHGHIEVVLPSERVIQLKVNRDIDVKNDVINGQAEAVITDSPKRGSPGSSISYKGKVTNTNYEKYQVDVEGQVEFKLVNGKNFVNSYSFKNIPQGEGKAKYDFTTKVQGNLIPKPASLAVSGNQDTSSSSLDNKMHVKANYGDDIGLEYTGSEIVKVHDKAGDKYQQDSTLNVRLPFEKAHDIKISSNVLFLIPADENVLAEFTLIEQVHVNADVYKFDTNGKLGFKTGFGKVKVLVPHQEPLVLETHYNADTEGEKKKVSVEVKSQYGKGKTANVAVGAQSAPQEFAVQVKAHAPQATNLKKLEVQFLTKVPTAETYSTSVSADVDGKVYGFDSLVVYSKTHPIVDLKYKNPTGAQSRLFVKSTSLGPNHGKFEVKVENIRDVSLDANGESNIQKDNVAFNFVANSEKFGLKNFKMDITSKDTNQGKRLIFHSNNDGKNIFSGSTSFISKQEGPKTIIEGSGAVKVKDEQKSANFKYISTQLTEGNEQGIEEFVNFAIGDRSYVAERRITNLEYKTSYVYCEEKKQCANAELQSKINVPKTGGFQHLVNVNFDLRKLGVAPEFGLQISSEVSEKKLPQYTLDLHVNKEDKKYYLHVYSQPEHGKFPAGITITLPHRVLALETLVTYPTNKAMPFPIKGEVALHLDKTKPQHKTAARFLVDVTGEKDQHAAVAQFGFSHPKLGKEALVKFQGKLALPADKSIKVETAASISHPTLGKDREAKFLLEADPVHVKLIIDTPLVKVIELEGSAIVKDNLQQGDLKFNLLQGKPVQIRAIVKDFTYYELTTGYSDESERRLSIVGHLEPESRVDISADIILNKEKKNIGFGALFLKDNLVKSDYGFSKDNFNYFISAVRKDITNLEQRVKQLGEQGSNDVKDVLKRVEPKFKELEKAYAEELEKLYKEVSNDKVLKEISEALHEITKFVAQFIDTIVQAAKPLVDQICNAVQEVCKKALELYEKQIEPQLKKVYGELATELKKQFEGVLDIIAHVAALIQSVFDKYKPELQELTNTFAEIFKDLTRIIVAQLKEYRGKVSQIIKDLIQQIQELPIINLIKEKWQELAIPEQALGLLQEAHNTIRNLLPTDETKSFADALFNYVMKKLRAEKVDDTAALRVIYEKFAVAFASVVKYVRTQVGTVGGPAFFNFNNLPIFGPGQASAPSFTGGVSFSLFNQLLRGDVPDALSLIRAYRPRRVNPLEEVPAVLRAVVVNGQHIFTFDGRHLTFPGSCRYVLAHDFVDRNFTLAIQLAAGAPKALILQDKGGNTIELKDNGQVSLNGQSHGYPVIEKESFAFRDVGNRIGLGSLYGVMVFCTQKLEVCYIEASGFYLGKLRGLLGDGNNEPYDDFRMPNGKITSSEAEFGHSYRLAGSCAQPTTPAHSHHSSQLPAACEQVFGRDSPLRPLGLVLDNAPFKQACVHAVEGDSANALRQACDLGRGYAALAVTGMLPAAVPAACLQCTDVDTPKNVGETYELKVPTKQADIVVAFETTKVPVLWTDTVELTVTGMLPAAVPAACLQCTDVDTPKNVGETYELKVPTKQADIVVTFETTKPTEDLYKKLVVPLVSQLVESLKGKHITDVKVHLIGITPKFPYPIIYDTDLKLKNPKINFDDKTRFETIPTVRTGCEKIDSYQKTVVDYVQYYRNRYGVTNVVEARKSILQLPLRPGATQHVINVVGEHCATACPILEFFRNLFFSNLYKNLPYSHSLVTISGPENPKKIVGYTKDGYLALGEKRVVKDEQLGKSLYENQDDACQHFALGTDGLVLAGGNFLRWDASAQKQFIQSAVSSVTHQMTSQTLTRKCVCAYVDPFRVRSVCVNEKVEAAKGRRK